MTIQLNGQPHPLAPHTTLAALLQQMRLEPRQVAVEVNLDVVPRTRHAEFLLQEGDRVEIVTLVGGG